MSQIKHVIVFVPSNTGAAKEKEKNNEEKKKRRSGGKQRRCYRSIQVFWTRACKGTSTEGNDQPRRECSSITSINLGVLARSYMEMHLSDL